MGAVLRLNQSDHFYLKAASETTHAHNQGPHIPTSTDQDYRAKDVTGFLHYVYCWARMAYHHHWVEEEFIFLEMGKFSATKPEQYRWMGLSGMKQIMDSFTKDLADDLYGEIGVLLELGDLGTEEYTKTWSKAETIAKQSGNVRLLFEMIPIVIGSVDKTYEGGHEFPPFPWVMRYLDMYRFAARNGAWRFNPCDLWKNKGL
ncbi:hypothetical protein F5B21DRAFT_517688 [Xylaria acuta]|nr:hypothetical protein F5B21DRAFT_517688 [Xylaria acuta]